MNPIKIDHKGRFVVSDKTRVYGRYKTLESALYRMRQVQKSQRRESAPDSPLTLGAGHVPARS